MTNNNKSINMPLEEINTDFTLPQSYYTSTEVFELELERIFYSKWIYTACDADIPKQGDYITLKIGAKSIFLQRGENSKVHGYFNVCRHRGHELLPGEKGNCRRLVCPYHSWTYDLEGKLLHANDIEL